MTNPDTLGVISGEVMIRPVRVAFIAKQITESALRKAARMASRVWGGVYFPVYSADGEVSRASEHLAIDVWHPLDDDPETVSMCDSHGFRWRGRGPYGPFEGSEDAEFQTGLLPIERVVPADVLEASELSWDEAHDLAPLYDVWLGASTAQQGVRGAHGSSPFQGATMLHPAQPTPIEMTGMHLEYGGESPGLCVVIIGSDVDDLLRLWNLRAMGAAVHPWVLGHEEECSPALSAWLSNPQVAKRAATWRSGDGSTSGRLAHISSGSHRGETAGIAAILEREGYESQDYEPLPWGGWRGIHPLHTDFERSFSAPVSRETWDVEIPLPALGLNGKASSWPGVVVADIHVYQESRTPQDRTLAVPAIRDLAGVIERMTPGLEQFDRGTGNGRAIAIQAASESVTTRLAPTFAVFSHLFRDAAKVEQSDIGRFETELINRLGGQESSAATEPGLRQVLYSLSSTERAQPIAKLIQSAEKSRGEWPGALVRSDGRSYAKSVVYRLAGSRLIVPTMRIRCPTCATATDVRPEDLATTMRCELCLADLNLGLALALHGRQETWRYQLAAGLSQQRVRSALAVMAVFSILRMSHRAGSSPAMPHVFGLGLSNDGWNCEIDIAALVVDGPLTVALLGEAKGGSERFDRADVDNLIRAQGFLRRIGIETLVVFGTTRARLDPGEVEILRDACGRSPSRLLHRPYRVEPALPIVLCGADVSLPWMDDGHPWRWPDPGGLPLAGLAGESCRRNLGLRDVAGDASDPSHWVLTWDSLDSDS